MNVVERWDQLQPAVRSLSPERQLLFAVFTASRTAKYYDEYCRREKCSEPELLDRILNIAWSGEKLANPEAAKRRLLSQIDRLENSKLWPSCAVEEACIGAYCLVELLTGTDIDEQVRLILNTTRNAVEELAAGNPGDTVTAMTVAEIEALISASPLMKEELIRHEEALELLLSEPNLFTARQELKRLV